MSILTADFPSGDPGLYGTNVAAMLDGPYASADITGLVTDPDGVSGGNVVYINSNSPKHIRYVLPAARTTVGACFRIWVPNLNFNTGVLPGLAFGAPYDATNRCLVSFDTTGRVFIRAITGGGFGTATTIATSSGPVITAAGWYHVEIKATFGAGATDSAEVRVRGRNVLSVSGVDLAQSNVIQVSLGLPNVSGIQSSGSVVYYKDFVVWDDQGTENNDFLGDVSVFWRRPVSTLAAGGWISSAGADADETVNKPRLANVLTASGVISSGNQVRINSTYYNWTSGSVDAGTPLGTSANPWLVAMGADTEEALANMYAAIGGTGTPGVTYSTALTVHTTVTPFGLTDTQLAVIPTNGTTVSMTFSETGANTAWLSTTAFQNQDHDAIRMSVDYISAVAATGSVTFSGLPIANETVTIGGTEIYTFKAAAAAPFEVTIGADANATGANLATVIGADSILVTGVNAAGVVTLTAISAGASGNSITLAEAATNTTVSGATLTGGEDVTYPDPFVVALEPLPPDVTRIRAVIPIVRAAKIDGGDGAVQASFGISEASYDDGPETVLTTAFTFWGNPADPFVSELNPLTAAAWTPGEFNIGARMKVNRVI